MGGWKGGGPCPRFAFISSSSFSDRFFPAAWVFLVPASILPRFEGRADGSGGRRGTRARRGKEGQGGKKVKKKELKSAGRGSFLLSLIAVCTFIHILKGRLSRRPVLPLPLSMLVLRPLRLAPPTLASLGTWPPCPHLSIVPRKLCLTHLLEASFRPPIHRNQTP